MARSKYRSSASRAAAHAGRTDPGFRIEIPGPGGFGTGYGMIAVTMIDGFHPIDLALCPPRGPRNRCFRNA